MGRDEIQRMVGGSDADSREVIGATAEAATADRRPDLSAKADQALGLIDDLDAALADSPLAAAQPSAAVEAAPAPPPPPAFAALTTIFPDFSQRVDVGTGARAIVMVVAMPLLSGAREATLDLAPRHFKLRGQPAAAAEAAKGGGGGCLGGGVVEYLLSTELSETVDPSRATAKWSKKTKALTVTLPVVG